MNKDNIDEFGPSFFAKLQHISDHVASWPYWKKEGWYHLDDKCTKEEFERMFGKEEDEQRKEESR